MTADGLVPTKFIHLSLSRVEPRCAENISSLLADCFADVIIRLESLDDPRLRYEATMMEHSREREISSRRNYPSRKGASLRSVEQRFGTTFRWIRARWSNNVFVSRQEDGMPVTPFWEERCDIKNGFRGGRGPSTDC
jgi:hypothetical protein